MPEIDFNPIHKRATNEALEFDRLKLKKDEHARIVLMEKPTFAYVHTLRAPKLVNGKAVKVEKETRKGEKYLDFDMDFVGRPLCLGDYGVLADTGVDETNCPACKRSANTDEVNAPERRFAMNIVRYGMTRDGKLIQPFKCDSLVWGFTDRVYNRLIDIAEEHGSLVGRDLLLVCTNEPFQNFEIQAGAQSLWQANDKVKETVTATFAQNRITELERACGRKAEPKWMIKDLNSIAERWRIARGESEASQGLDDQALSAGLADLLGATPAVESGTRAAAAPADFGDLLGSGNPEAPAPAGSGDLLDFSALLDPSH